MKGSHWRKSHLGVYNGLTGLHLMPCKHIFGSQIEKNMLDQSEMVLLFSLLFSYVVATSKAITSDFIQRLITRLAQASLLRKSAWINCFCFEGKTALAYCVGSQFLGLSRGLKTWSVQMLWTCAGKNFRVTRETFHFICTTVAPVIFILWHRQAIIGLRCFSSKTWCDLIKFYHQHVCQRASIGWLPWDFNCWFSLSHNEKIKSKLLNKNSQELVIL